MSNIKQGKIIIMMNGLRFAQNANEWCLVSYCGIDWSLIIRKNAVLYSCFKTVEKKSNLFLKLYFFMLNSAVFNSSAQRQWTWTPPAAKSYTQVFMTITYLWWELNWYKPRCVNDTALRISFTRTPTCQHDRNKDSCQVGWDTHYRK